MKRFWIPACLALAATAASAEDLMISDVDVHVELSDIENANALDFWPEIGPDLDATITALAAPMMAETGYEIDVRVSEIAISDSAVLTGDGEFNQLGGWVYIREPGNPVPVKDAQIMLDASTGALGGNSEVILVPGRPDFYNALINVFALRTIEEVNDL